MKTDNFECESCRVTEDDSNDEKSGTEVDSCVKGSRTRKVSNYTLYEDREAVRNVQIGVIWGTRWSLRVIRNVTIR